MSQDLLNRKWNNFFEHFDADRNGFIEHEDFVLRGAQVVTACGYPADSTRATAVTDGFRTVWTSLAGSLDADGDERISRDEFITGMARLAGDEGDDYDALFQPAIDALLIMGDADEDGRLGMDDWLRLQVGYGTPRADAETSFHLLDTDGNGYLTRDEISAATRDYFTSTDPAAPGNNLYGPLA